MIVISSIFSGVVGIYTGLLIHELTHYAVGKVRRSNPTMVTDRFHLPHMVEFENPDKMSYRTIRIATGLVIIYPILLVIYILFTGIPDLGVESLLLYTLLGASIMSPADWLGLLYPERWQEFAINYSDEGHRETLRILLTEARSSN